jgi:diguanylate cyclase (GGDEF)-like protein
MSSTMKVEGYGRIVFAAVLAVVSAIYLAAPDSWGGIAFFGTAACGLVSMIVGPLIHRPANKRPWYWMSAAGALFLIGLLFRLDLVPVPGPIGVPDPWTFGGYACTAMFLAELLRLTHTGPDRTLWLDTAAVTAGSALIGWVMGVAPQLAKADHDLGSTVVNVVYPVMDAVLLALIVQLSFRRGSRAPAMRAGVVGMAALLLGDLAYTFLWAEHPGAVSPYPNVFYLVAYACIGLMAVHPSMRELSDVDARHTPSTSRVRRLFLFLGILLPTSIPVMLPTQNLLDGVVRAVFMTVLATVIFLRLLGIIQAHQQAEARADYRATHDGLTNLPNRIALLESLDGHLAEIRALDRPGYVNVFFLNCDHFKQINVSWGHSVGDQILVQLAERLRSVVSPGDFLARVGGDEFVLRIDTDEREQAAAVAARIMAIFLTPLAISSDRTTLVTPSIGIAQARYSAAATAENMIRDSDLALYQAKSAGRSTFAIHDSMMHEQVLRWQRLADALRGALGRAEIRVVFQPIRGGAGFSELIGWEALVRWEHPELGAISPVEFIPVAEDTGLIVDIGAFVLYVAVSQLKRWQDRYNRPDLHVSVNVSSVQLLRDDMVDRVSRVLAEIGLKPETLWLEVTESVLLERTKEALTTLNALADLGLRLVMDDFGTGYSSLSYLKDFPLHVLKVDQSFISHLVEDPRDRKLTKAIIDVAAALGLEGVVAEGVETEEQAATLLELGCSLAQGYLFGRPESAPQAETEAEAASLLVAPDHPSRVGAQRVSRGSTI